jgi:glycosyltransferase involved in cell wall biosynthesis
MFVMSSHTEGLPIAVIEAMSAGLAVLATDVGGLSELVKDGVSGRLVGPGDTHAFADSIVSFANDRDGTRLMGQSGKRRAEEFFSIESTVRGHESLYLELLGMLTDDSYE